MDIIQTGSAKQRRDQLKVLTEELGVELPFDYGKISQLRTLKAACAFLRKIKHFANWLKRIETSIQADAELGLLRYGHGALAREHHKISSLVSSYDLFLNEGLLGFIVCFSRKGELIYLSENIIDYLGFKSMEILLSYDFIYEIAHDQDRQAYEHLLNNYLSYAKSKQSISMFSLWFVSKIKRKNPPMSEYKLFKMAGHYDTETDMFIMKCTPILSIGNRDSLISSEAKYFSSAHHLNLKFSELSKNGEILLGYNNRDFDANSGAKHQNLTLYDIVCPDYLKIICERHANLLRTKDLKGSLDCVKLIHANGSYVDCLLNMYYDNRGFIICKFQAMSLQDITKYTEYSAKLDQDWFLNSPGDNETQSGLNDSTYGDLDDDLDDTSTPRSSQSSKQPKHRFSMEEQVNVNVGLKRKFNSFDASLGDEVTIDIDPSKFAKRNDDFLRLDKETFESDDIFDLSANPAGVAVMRNKAATTSDDTVKRLSSLDVIEINNIKSNLEEEVKRYTMTTNDAAFNGQLQMAYHHNHHQTNMLIPSQFNAANLTVNSGFLIATDTPDLAQSNNNMDAQKFKQEPQVQALGLDRLLFNETNAVGYNTQSSSYLDYDNHEIDETALQNFIKFEESLESLNASISSYKSTGGYGHDEPYVDNNNKNPFQHQIDNLFLLGDDDVDETEEAANHSGFGGGKFGSYHYWHRLNAAASKIEQNEF